MPALSNDSLATVITCSKCNGHVMSTITKFASKKDLQEIELAKKLGFIVTEVPARKLGNYLNECMCRKIS